MRAEVFPKGGSPGLQQTRCPTFGFVYIVLAMFVQFVWGGMKAAKILLMVEELNFSENEAVIIIHLQSTFMDVVMCLGHIMASLYCGAYITCVLQELLKALVTCPLCTFATMGIFDLEGRRRFYLFGQAAGVLTAFANSSLASFLADQFNIINYIKFNRVHFITTMACTALGIFTAPHLIQYYKCFWTETCYSFVWLCEWALCIITIFIFLGFYKELQRTKPKSSAHCMLIKLTRDAFIMKRRSSKLGKFPDKPLLEYSDLYTKQFRRDAQRMLSMWSFYFPLAGFWALHSQQSTTWILQAKRLNGDLFGWSTVLPNELWGVIPLTGIALRQLLLSVLEGTKYPLRMTVFSQLIMSIAFMLAAILEKYVMSEGDKALHMAWALPQLLLVSLSDIMLIASYRKFIIREVPTSFRGVSQTFFVLSRGFGNLIVVLLNLMETITGFPNRLGQFIIYATVLNLFLIVFTVLNRRYERLLEDERRSSDPGTSRNSRSY